MKKVKFTLTLISILLFVFNYQICEYFYPLDEDLNSWWTLKLNIYAVIIGLVFLSQSLKTESWLRFILEIGVGLAISNIIDKLYYDIRVFTENDIYMILITLSIATYNFINGRKRNKKA